MKENKITKLNTLDAGNTRPITVESVWWRCYCSCWVSGPDVAAWRKHYIPPDVVGGKGAKCCEGCATYVTDKFREHGFLGTLDYSLCYDHMDPLLFTGVVQQLKWPEDLLDRM